MLARAVPPRAIGGDATLRRGDAAVAVVPPDSQGPPIDIGDLPPLEPAATTAPPPAASTDVGPVRRGPASATPVWTTVSASPSAQSTAGADACHNYTATRTLLGEPRQVSGLACREPNGQWQIISEVPR